MTEKTPVKPKKTALILALVAVVLVIAVIFAAVLFFIINGPKAPVTDGEMVNGDMEISTDYCTLYFPSRWQDYVQVTQDGKTVLFQGEIEGYTQPLFAIHFDLEEGIPYGTITADSGAEVSVSLTIHSFELMDGMAQEDLDTLYGMQEDMNYLCGKLPLVDSLQNAQDEAEQDDEPVFGDVIIETTYGRLKYPGQWEPYLRVNVVEDDACLVEFYANVKDHPELHLFDVRINPDDSGSIPLHLEGGEACTLDVEFHVGELDDAWEAQDADIIYGMIEGFNYLIDPQS